MTTTEHELDNIQIEDIRTSTNEAELHRWYAHYVGKIDNVKAQLEAAKVGGTVTQDWVSRCGGFIAVAQRITRAVPVRCRELGFDPPVDWLQAGEEKERLRKAAEGKARMIRAEARTELAAWIMAEERRGMTAPEADASLLLRWHEKGGEE